jgi:hypothetical protein
VTEYLIASTTVVRIRTDLRLSVTNGVIPVFSFDARVPALLCTSLVEKDGFAVAAYKRRDE